VEAPAALLIPTGGVMAGTFSFDKAAILDAVRRGMEEALEEAGDRVAAEAKQRAPVRKVFAERPGFRRRFRPLPGSTRSLVIQRAVGYYGYRGFIARLGAANPPGTSLLTAVRKYSRAEVRRPGSANALVRSRTLRLLGTERGGRFSGVGGTARNRSGGYEPGPALSQALTSRGKYEVRSGRAVHIETSASGASARVQVGGALKASIGSEGVVQTPHGQKVTVSAAIRYAKYVEFPTIRTAAQPFLLPALMSERQRLPREMAAKIKRNLGG